MRIGSAAAVVRASQRIVIAGLLLAAIAVMIAGVVLRYVMVPIADALDLDAINFVWVEETGELLQTYLAMIGGAVAIAEGGHFVVNLVVQHLSRRAQKAINIFNCAVIAVFGGLLAWQGWRLALLNWPLESPSLGVSLGWFYMAAVVGGVLLIAYAGRAAMTLPGDPIPVRVE